MRTTIVRLIIGLLGLSAFEMVPGSWQRAFNRWQNWPMEYDTIHVASPDTYVLVPVTEPIKAKGKDIIMDGHGSRRMYGIAADCCIMYDNSVMWQHPQMEYMVDSMYQIENDSIREWIGYRAGLYYREIYFHKHGITLGYYGFPLGQMARIDSCINTIRVLSLPDSLRRHRNTK